MGAVSFSKVSVNVYQTKRCNNPHDSAHNIHRHENLKSHTEYDICNGVYYKVDYHNLVKFSPSSTVMLNIQNLARRKQHPIYKFIAIKSGQENRY
jgi:wobble nucleotide-excising tRNase